VIRRLLALAGVVGLAVVSLSGIASADHLILEVAGPDEVVVGEEVEVTATVRDTATGAPVEGVEVVFFGDATFAGVNGDLELGRAVSNEIGVATFVTDFTVSRIHTVRVEVVDSPDVAPASVPIAVEVGGQLVFTEPIVELPAVGSWIVRLVLGGVWAIMIVAALWVVRVSRSARVVTAEGAPVSKAQLRRPVRGGVNWAVIVATAMMAVGTGIMVLLIRSPNTRANLNPEGYNRAAVAYLDAAYFYPGVGLAEEALTGNRVEDGRTLFVAKGCAGCHGLNAQGTAAAGSPAFATRQWLGTVVRSGQPGGMPSFDATDVTEGEIDLMHTFLLAVRDDLAGETEPTAATTTTEAQAEAAPSTSAPSGGETDGATLSFADDVAPILATNCAGCHGTAGGWSAADYDAVLTAGASGPAVVPGDPDASVLAQKITGTQTSGGAMPPGGSLSDADIATIVDWIASGAGP
jgi:mono/diheme cytochrome c family protein